MAWFVPLLTAVATDMQQRSDASDARQRLLDRHLANLRESQAVAAGADPSTMANIDYFRSVDDLDRQIEESRNNRIGQLLQDYLSPKKKVAEEAPRAPTDWSRIRRNADRSDPRRGLETFSNYGDVNDLLDPWGRR